MNPDISIIVSISIILLFSPFFAKITHLPTTPVEIIFGSIAGYFGYIHHTYVFELIAEVGFLYLMFLAGLEVDIKKILKTSPTLIKKGILYLSVLYLLSLIAALFIDNGKIFIVILPLISIGLLATITKEYGKEYKWIQYAIVIGVLGEIMSIILLTIVSAAVSFGIGYEFYKTIFILILFFIASYTVFRVVRVLFWWYPEIKIYLMPHQDKQERDIRISFAIFFLTIAFTLYLHLEVAFGAFIAGVFIASFFEHKKELPEKLEGFGFGLLVPIFFIYIGSSFDLNSLLLDKLLSTTLLITLLMITFRILSALVFIKDLGFKNSSLFALSHSMPLTLIIAVATLTHQSNSIDNLHYFAFILAAILEVVFVMLLIKSILKFSHSIHNVNR